MSHPKDTKPTEPLDAPEPEDEQGDDEGGSVPDPPH